MYRLEPPGGAGAADVEADAIGTRVAADGAVFDDAVAAGDRDILDPDIADGIAKDEQAVGIIPQQRVRYSNKANARPRRVAVAATRPGPKVPRCR